MASQSYQRVNGTGQTVGTATTIIASFALAAGHSAAATATCVGRTAAGDTFTAVVMRGHKNVTGTGSNVGGLTTVYAAGDAAISTASVVLAITAGGSIDLSATGVLVQTINWSALLEIQDHEP